MNIQPLVSDPELRRALDMLRAGEAQIMAKSLPAADHEVAEVQRLADETLARVAWSRLAEPGDGMAGALIHAIGAAGSLRLLIEGATARALAAAVASHGEELANASWKAAIDRWLPRLDQRATLDDIARANHAGIRLLIPESAAWPEALNDLGAHAPTVLWLRGDHSYLAERQLAVVGARAVSSYGAHVTAELVDGVCRAGCAVTSGAAYGVDAVAHRTALATGGITIAVLAGGVDRPYPAAHEALLDQIAERGVVCSEMVPGAAPTRWRFLQRNRLIAALSEATLVTEAGVRSGTINTAGHASELGRALGAVPGPVTSAGSAGCHRLIREYGAALVTNVAEACELMGITLEDNMILGAPGAGGVAGHSSGRSSDRSPASSGSAPREPSLHQRVLDALPLRGSHDLDEIVRRAGVSPREAIATLAELELLNKVTVRETHDTGARKWSLVRRQ